MNPYATKGPEHFWKRAVAGIPPEDVFPVPAKAFQFAPGATVATAGSCFAQNLTRHLAARATPRVLMAEAIAPDQPPFSARYGNIYTLRQLNQLFDEAFALRTPEDAICRRADGRYVDALRPFLFASGFATPAAVRTERAEHLAAVRTLFSTCGTFVFTLGLTEAWLSTADGTAYPVAPGIVSDEAAGWARFHNFNFRETADDLDGFVARMRRVNAAANLLLTVSPVPLSATYEADHVLIATAQSKAVLRAACGEAQLRHEQVFYFPAYEIVTGPFSRGSYLEENLRTVTPEGIAHVMRVFDAVYCGVAAGAPPLTNASVPSAFDASHEDVCDDTEITRSLGFD